MSNSKPRYTVNQINTALTTVLNWKWALSLISGLDKNATYTWESLNYYLYYHRGLAPKHIAKVMTTINHK